MELDKALVMYDLFEDRLVLFHLDMAWMASRFICIGEY